jgi:hypothetical protein
MKRDPLPWICLFIIAALLLALCFPLRFHVRRSATFSKYSTTYVRIEPANSSSLVDHVTFITNSTNINDITIAVNSAKEYFPNHPQTYWQCDLIISDASGEKCYNVINTDGQGTILYLKAGGFLLHPIRSDTLGAILEKATTP